MKNCSGRVYSTKRRSSGRACSTKRRKSIRLKHYDYNSNGYYFVTVCTDLKTPYLQKRKIKEIVVAELARLSKRFSGVKIDYSVVMVNHIHIILYFEDTKFSLPQVIQAFKSITTLKAKQALPLQVKGVLWQRNYYEHVIRNEKALLKIRRYVENNPIVEKIKFEEFYEKAKQALPLQVGVV